MFKNFSKAFCVVVFFGGVGRSSALFSERQRSQANDLERMRGLGGIPIRQSKQEGDQACNKHQACIICAII